MAKSADISVIIINYNSSAYTLKSTASVFEKNESGLTVEVVVVDNNSRPDDYANLAAHFPQAENIKLVRSRINTGFGGGNMFGVQFATGRYLLFLNNDAFLMNDCLAMHYNFHESNSTIGVTSAQNFDQHGAFVPSFDHNKGFRKILFGRSFLEKYYPATHPKRKKQHDREIQVDFISGAFMFFKTETFSRIGGFDNNIFLYFEEMDVSLRLKKLGYTTHLLPQSHIEHHQGASSVKSIPMDREGLISYMYVIKKHYPYLKFLLVKYYLLLTFLLKPKKWGTLATVFKSPCLEESLKQKQQISG